MGQSMLTTASLASLRLGRLSLPHPTLDSSASLIGGHVAFGLKLELESGTFLMGQHFHQYVVLVHFIETEEMMEQST